MPVFARASTLADGTMSSPQGATTDVQQHRTKWLSTLRISPEHTTLLKVTYGEGIDYLRIKTADVADKGRGIIDLEHNVIADALFTREKSHALFLPLADCGGVVLFDARQRILGVVHLGRQATFAGLAARTIDYMVEQFGTDPADVHVWISPSISGDSYHLKYFDFADDPAWQPFTRKDGEGWLVDLQAYNTAQMVAAGVPEAHIDHSGVDTATHPDYPSHHRFSVHNEQSKAGRFAIVAMIKEGK